MTAAAARDPATTRFSYADVDRFAAALVALDTTRDSAAVLHRYLLEGTKGLRAYAGQFRVSDSSMLAALRRHPGHYRVLRDLPARLRAEEAHVRAGLAALERLYPRAVHPPIWYVIGNGRAGGQASRHGVLIGADVYGVPDDSSEATDQMLARGLHRTREVASLVVHETVHFNQAADAPLTYLRTWNNLARALKEGSADFVAELATGATINAPAHAYGGAREGELWAAFAPTLNTTTTEPWFFVRPADGRPPDLGYYLGYRIVRAHYLRSSDARTGVRAIMELRDYDRFLRASGYAP